MTQPMTSSKRTSTRAKAAWLIAGFAWLTLGCGGANASREGEIQWIDESNQTCEEISPALCAYTAKHEPALDALADKADDASDDVSDGMPAALKTRAEIAKDLTLALQAYAVPNDADLGLESATTQQREACVNECIAAELQSLRQRISGQIPATQLNDFVEEAREGIKLSCEASGSMSHVTDDCLARLNPAQKARTWLQNRADKRYRAPLKALITSMMPVQQLVLFKTEMALNFASLSDKDMDALYFALVAAKASGNTFIRLCETTDRAMPLRVLDPIENWTRSVAEITGAIDTTAKKCGSGCSPAWRKAAGR